MHVCTDGDRNLAMESWAYCRTCERWYYLPQRGHVDGNGPLPTCPVCASQPAEVRHVPVS